MPAVSGIPQHYVTQFSTNWEHLVSQMLSKARDCVVVETVEGKEKTFNQIGGGEFQRLTQRAGTTRISDLINAKRWLRPYPMDYANLYDEWDDTFLGAVVLPTSETVQEHAAAYNRAIDKTIFEAATGTNYIGETGQTPVTVPSGQIVAVDYNETASPANAGMTIAKLRRAKFILDENEVDDEGRYLAYTSTQLQDLLRTTEVTSSDYNTVKALVEGKVDTFLGFKFKRMSSKILTRTGEIRTCFFWHKSGIKIADSGRQTYFDKRADLSHALQIRSVAALGGTRTQEEKVGIIYCDEVP